jgi:NAD(P)-dependent dehydrogenase (short-subunit alcohol dehydrogenase family)
LKNLFDLSGRRAIITGGAGRLGVCHAKSLLQNGCNVELWDINEELLASARENLAQEFSSSLIEVRRIDITNELEIKAKLTESRHLKQNIDILVNNAAINPKYLKNEQRPNYLFESYPLEMWNQEIQVGLTGAMLASKHVGSLMAEHNSGSIINIASDLSVISPDQRIYLKEGIPESEQFKKPISYSVIKTGLIGMTRYLATYWANSGVRVNAISPGGVFENQDSDFVEKLVSRIPMNRMATPQDYVGVIQFLASDASSYMTGQNMVIDGGRSVW